MNQTRDTTGSGSVPFSFGNTRQIVRDKQERDERDAQERERKRRESAIAKPVQTGLFWPDLPPAS